MKMGVGTRIIFTLFLIVIVALCIIIALAAFGVFPAEYIDGIIRGFTTTNFRYIYAGAALVLAVIAICLMFFGMKKAEPASVLLVTSVDGTVTITLEALRELMQRYFNSVNGVIVQRIGLRTIGERNVKASIAVAVRPNVSIPDITKKIDEEVRVYVEQYSGIMVTNVNVTVQAIQGNQNVK